MSVLIEPCYHSIPCIFVTIIYQTLCQTKIHGFCEQEIKLKKCPVSVGFFEWQNHHIALNRLIEQTEAQIRQYLRISLPPNQDIPRLEKIFGSHPPSKHFAVSWNLQWWSRPLVPAVRKSICSCSFKAKDKTKQFTRTMLNNYEQCINLQSWR